MPAFTNPQQSCAWGVHGAHRGQDLVVLGWLRHLGVRPYALCIAKCCHPQHPLIVGYDVELVPFTGRAG
jgi:hypothetical protein